MSKKEFFLLRMLNNKVVTILAMLSALMYARPSEKSFYLIDLQWAVLWFIGGIFVWKKKTWAAVLLALLSSYELIVHLIPDIMSLGSDVVNLKYKFENIPESVIYRVGLGVYSFGVIMESYVICYALKVIMSLKSKYSILR